MRSRPSSFASGSLFLEVGFGFSDICVSLATRPDSTKDQKRVSFSHSPTRSRALSCESERVRPKNIRDIAAPLPEKLPDSGRKTCKEMSRAFIKEDVDPPERSGRMRSASGLPPGAANYITPGGAARLERELWRLRCAGADDGERLAKIEKTLGSVTVVEPLVDSEPGVGFGAKVTVRDAANQLKTYRILGVDELDLDPAAISWISPLGRTLLAAELGDQVNLLETGPARIVKVEYPND